MAKKYRDLHEIFILTQHLSLILLKIITLYFHAICLKDRDVIQYIGIQDQNRTQLLDSYFRANYFLRNCAIIPVFERKLLQILRTVKQ